MTPHSALFESRPLEQIRIGDQRWSGWSFADGAVQVLRTQGHCAGQVVVWFPALGHLHVSDETTGACQSFHDCDNVKHVEALSKTLGLLEASVVRA
ncbi:MAG: hypothetical protein U5R31_00710 [Acidimicrobiia bacterium]|nr:hypothetical protein [Acidimicrobiia bacterium]